MKNGRIIAEIAYEEGFESIEDLFNFVATDGASRGKCGACGAIGECDFYAARDYCPECDEPAVRSIEVLAGI